MPTGYSLYQNQPRTQETQPNLHETFTARQARLGSTPNPANRTLYPQSSNHAIAAQEPAKQYEGYSPNINIAGTSLMNAFKTKQKRDMSDQEKAALAKYVGYGGGDLTQDQWNKANWSVEHYSGDINNPGVPDYNPASTQSPGINPGTAGPRQPNAAGWQGTPGYGIAPPSNYTPDTASAPGEYNPFQFAQWTGQEDGATGDQMQGILDQILGNPEVLNEQTVNQMKTRSKESALVQNDQLLSSLSSDLAGRGFAGGGMEAFGKIAAGNDLRNSLINQNRDIDIASKEKNRASTLDALGAADSLLNSRLGRASENYGNTLQGQGAQAGENQFGAGFNMDRFSRLEELAQKQNDSEFRNAEFSYGQVRDDRDSRLKEFLAEEGVNLDRDKFKELQTQFKAATGLDLLKFLESQRQFDTTFGENKRQFNTSTGENARQFNTSAGIQTAGLQLQGQNQLQNFINSLYGNN